MPHDFSPKYANLLNLQQYVIKEKKLPESLAIKILFNIVEVVSRLHNVSFKPCIDIKQGLQCKRKLVLSFLQQNVVHRDLKLGNVVMDKETLEVTLINFGLGRHLINENEQLKDQRGSPAYISPEVIGGKPYLGKFVECRVRMAKLGQAFIFVWLITGKPSDMWALGVVLYTMLYGQFPFYDSVPTELFRKIKLAEYSIPT